MVGPVFRDLSRRGLDEAQLVREILGEEPAAVAINHRDLVEAQPVDVVVFEPHERVMDEEVAHLGPVEREHPATCVAGPGKVQAVGVVGLGR